MNAVILTREDAEHIRHGLNPVLGREDHSHKTLDQGSNGAEWLDAVTDEVLEILHEIVNTDNGWHVSPCIVISIHAQMEERLANK